MIVLVCGGRNFDQPVLLATELHKVHDVTPITQLIHGGGKGADALADAWAMHHGIPRRPFYANWHDHGRAAGPIRNQRMIAEGKPDLVIAFAGGPGTRDLVFRAQDAEIEVVLVR